MIPWILFGLLHGGLLVASSVLLLRERHHSAWLMLAGSVTTTVGSIASYLIPLMMTFNGASPTMQIYQAVSALSALGALTFAIGLLLHVLQRRGQAARIAELELILHSRDVQR
jgi:hypothetical protein